MEQCTDCRRPIEQDGYSRCNRCMDIFGNMTYSQLCAIDDTNYEDTHHSLYEEVEA
jgi:hypothetical protein